MCDHKETKVSNSRTKNEVNTYGNFVLSRREYDFIIQRTRHCLACGHKFKTLEVDLTDYEELFDFRDSMKKLMKQPTKGSEQ